MAQITAALVKELRDSTGVGMMDCKKALTKVEGDLEAAVDWLRKSGLAAAAKKAGRVAAEGLVSVKTHGTAGFELGASIFYPERNEPPWRHGWGMFGWSMESMVDWRSIDGNASARASSSRSGSGLSMG